MDLRLEEIRTIMLFNDAYLVGNLEGEECSCFSHTVVSVGVIVAKIKEEASMWCLAGAV